MVEMGKKGCRFALPLSGLGDLKLGDLLPVVVWEMVNHNV
jgi:hypothetical protein